MSEIARLSTKTRYVCPTRIIDVVKKELTVGGKKSSDGTSELIIEDAGWYIVLDGHLSIPVGHDEPLLRKGDKVNFIIERQD